MGFLEYFWMERSIILREENLLSYVKQSLIISVASTFLEGRMKNVLAMLMIDCDF